MNNMFMGTCAKHGEIYDYTGIWTRVGPRIAWKAVVRNADVVCRPYGEIVDEPGDSDVLRLIEDFIEADIEQQKHR